MKCVDCNKSLNKIQYVRPGWGTDRDPLCKPCWEKTDKNIGRRP